MLLGCDYFLDVLKPCSMLFKVLQNDEVFVVQAVEALIRVKKDLDRKKEVNFEELPTVKIVCDRVKTVDGTKTYQQAEVKKYETSIAFYSAHYKKYMDTIQTTCRN